MGRWLGFGLLLGWTLGLAGCRGKAPGESAQKSYHLRGKIVAVGSGTATVNAGAIAGLMEAMTMDYKLADPTVGSELHPGDMITAQVLVDESPDGPTNLRLDQIVVVGQARPDYKQAVQYHVPAPGEQVPDFKLLNQSGREIHLSQFRGKAVLLTFIYTRCPIADYCPRMSENFAAIDRELAKDKAAYRRTHLVSVSFDPAYDTPAVLRSYGGAHTGRFTEEDFAHWDFAAPSVAELPKVEQWFDVGVTGNSRAPETIQHSLSTVLIGRDGRVVAWWPSNDWKVAEVLAAVEKEAGGAGIRG
jgi:protein SCO1/2